MTTTEANTLNRLPGAGPPMPRVPAHQLPVSSGELTKAGETAFPVRPAANRGQTVSERPSRDAAPRQRGPAEVHLGAPGERRVPAPGLRLRHPSPRWKPLARTAVHIALHPSSADSAACTWPHPKTAWARKPDGWYEGCYNSRPIAEAPGPCSRSDPPQSPPGHP